MSDKLEIVTVPKNLYYHEVAYVRGLEAKVEQLTELAEKYKWQVIDTCTRAEAAERERDELREALKRITEVDDWLKRRPRAALEAKP